MILDQCSTTIVLERRAPGSYTNGEWSKGTATRSVIRAFVQPASGRELQLLPEDLRTQETIRVWTKIKLNITNDPDVVIYKNVRYEVQRVEDWSPSHYKSYAVREAVNQQT